MSATTRANLLTAAGDLTDNDIDELAAAVTPQLASNELDVKAALVTLRSHAQGEDGQPDAGAID